MEVSSVSEFVLQIRTLIERNCPLGWIGGEVSNLVQATSGHIYFTLKDERAQIRCAMWRNKAQLLGFRLSEGMQIEVRAQATVYEARGDLQLSVENIRRAGLGSLFEAFLRLKAKLEAEGLFDTSRKREIPARPAGVALVTSSRGAALHDILTILSRRAPSLPVTLYPTLVQGDAAAAQIAAAITQADTRAKQDGCELLLVCRGGGSMEDLWAFNHEAVARAIAACQLPVISGVGHETDTTLADFAADLRAPTPSAAAEIASAGWFALRQQLPELQHALQKQMRQRINQAFQLVDDLQRHLIHPRARLAHSSERVTSLGRQLQQMMRSRQREARIHMETMETRLRISAPQIRPLLKHITRIDASIQSALQHKLDIARQHTTHLAARLEGLNPDAVLARGYAIVRDASGQILRNAANSKTGDALDIQLAKGHIKARIEKG